MQNQVPLKLIYFRYPLQSKHDWTFDIKKKADIYYRLYENTSALSAL